MNQLLMAVGGAVVLVLGAGAMSAWKTDRKRSMLMFAAAFVLAVNILLWGTMPQP